MTIDNLQIIESFNLERRSGVRETDYKLSIDNTDINSLIDRLRQNNIHVDSQSSYLLVEEDEKQIQVPLGTELDDGVKIIEYRLNAGEIDIKLKELDSDNGVLCHILGRDLTSYHNIVIIAKQTIQKIEGYYHRNEDSCDDPI